ncbi:MAG: hypothetical protein ACRDY7_06555 [Acidimicrobiia bacterium]
MVLGLSSAGAGRGDARAAAPVGCVPQWGRAELIGSLPGPLTEVSGFVSSQRYPGVAWMIRDSDNPESLYSFELDGGKPRWREFEVDDADNYDWEDLTYTLGPDGRGRLWILENGVETGPKKLYEVLEPDPGGDEDEAEVVNTYRFDYPGASLNTEALFAVGGRIVVVSKTSPNGVYQLPSSLSDDGMNMVSRVGRLDVGSFLTMAATSADERFLVTVGTDDVASVVQTADPAAGASGFVDPEPVFERSMPETQREAGDFFPFASCDIVLVSEDSTVWRLSGSGSPGAAPGDLAPTAVPPAQPVPPPASSPSPPPPPPPQAPAPATPRPAAQAAPPRSGYWMLSSAGAVWGFGHAAHSGQPALAPGAAAVDVEPDPASRGYWVLEANGQVHAFGGAPHLGNAPIGELRDGETATSMTASPSGRGYWVFTNSGRALSFGDARFFGDMTAVALNGAVLDAVATPTGQGYYMVGSDGGVFTFGDARFAGSMGAVPLNAPVRSLVADPDGAGYWLVASDGGVFSFDAPFRGSTGALVLNRPITDMAAFGNGYLMVGSDGGVFNFSDRPFHGSLGAQPPPSPVVAIAVVP